MAPNAESTAEVQQRLTASGILPKEESKEKKQKVESDTWGNGSYTEWEKESSWQEVATIKSSGARSSWEDCGKSGSKAKPPSEPPKKKEYMKKEWEKKTSGWWGNGWKDYSEPHRR